MSAYYPPTENVPIFDASLFRTTNDTTSQYLTKDEADRLFLQYPFGQGTETIPSLIVSNNQTTGGNIVMNGTSGTNYLEFPDGTRQYTATSASTTQTIAYYRSGIVYGNQVPLATPLTINVNTGALTGAGITMCPLVFKMTFSYTNALTSNNQLDSGSVSTFCNTCSCIFNYFPFCSQPVVSGTNANYFTNGIGGATSNTAYYCPTIYGSYGRPFWCSAISNEANVAVVSPFTFTGTPFLNGLKQIVFNPPATGYPAVSGFYYEWTIEVINKGYFSGMITSTGFQQNLNC